MTLLFLQKFQEDVATVAEDVRKVFNEQHVSQMNLQITVRGAVTGDLKIEYTVNDSLYTTGVTAFALQPAIDELFRRRGWEQRNKSLALSPPTKKAKPEPEPEPEPLIYDNEQIMSADEIGSAPEAPLDDEIPF